jgi:allantoin racemase
VRILLVNGNRTQSVTDKVLAEARLVATPGTELVAVSAAFGADVVFSHAENVIATHAVLDSLARHHHGFDAAVLAISFDSGLAAARELLPIPVVGITESALRAACALGTRIGIITVGRVSDRLYADVFHGIDIGARSITRRTIDVATTSEYLAPDARDAQIAASAQELAAGGAEVVVICGAALAGVARRLRARVSIPLLDGVECAVRDAEARVRAGERREPRPPGPVATVTGVSSELDALYRALSQSKQ